jgi:hypothetical protein
MVDIEKETHPAGDGPGDRKDQRGPSVSAQPRFFLPGSHRQLVTAPARACRMRRIALAKSVPALRALGALCGYLFPRARAVNACGVRASKISLTKTRRTRRWPLFSSVLFVPPREHSVSGSTAASAVISAPSPMNLLRPSHRARRAWSPGPRPLYEVPASAMSSSRPRRR